MVGREASSATSHKIWTTNATAIKLHTVMNIFQSVFFTSLISNSSLFLKQIRVFMSIFILFRYCKIIEKIEQTKKNRWNWAKKNLRWWIFANLALLQNFISNSHSWQKKVILKKFGVWATSPLPSPGRVKGVSLTNIVIGYFSILERYKQFDNILDTTYTVSPFLNKHSQL